MFEFKPDYEEAKKRIDAWWECEIIDRAMTYITFPKPESERIPLPRKQHATIRDRWLDTEYRAECAYAYAANTVHYADAMPVQWPNLGPDIFAGFYGCDIEFGESTSWSVPNLHDWSPESVAEIQFDPDNFWFKKIMEMIDAFLEVGKGKFIVGYTDIHPGADALAAFRDPQNLCLDMILHPDEVKSLLARITDEFLDIFDMFNDKLTAAGMPSSSWMNIICDGKMHIPSNDFSCMISDRMFEEIFLPELRRECQHMTRNIYHLDGPGALRFLDKLLEIPEIHAIQWVYGAGQGTWRDWIDVYKRIQAAGKGFPVYIAASDLDDFMTCCRPEGVWLVVHGVADKEEADRVLKKITRWGK